MPHIIPLRSKVDRGSGRTIADNPYFPACEHFLFEYVEASRNQHEIERYDADFNRGCWQMAVAKVEKNEQPDYTKFPYNDED